MDYADVFEDIGALISDDALHEKVANLVMTLITESYQEGERMGREAAANELEQYWEPGSGAVVDVSKLDKVIYADIEEFIDENPNKAPPVSPMSNLDAYLKWNGIIGYTEQIQRAVHTIERAVYIKGRTS